MFNHSTRICQALFAVVFCLSLLGASAYAQTTAFTYQGKLADNGTPANGNYDFQFSLFDALSGGTQLGTTQTLTNQLVTNGIFSVTLDFVNCAGCSCPTCFNGGARFLDIVIRAQINSDSNAGLALTLSDLPKWSVATVTGGQFQIFNDALGSNALWITAANNFVGIGTNSPDQLLSVNGNASKAGGGSWATFSDERLKTIHGRYTRGLNAVMKLQPIRYEYKRDNALGLPSSGESIGFSAQEIEHILPEAVTHSTSGYLQINNDPILWTMLNAVKEQQAQITSQQSQLKQQTAEIQTQQRNIEHQAKQIQSLHHLLNQQEQLFRRQQQQLAALQRRLAWSQRKSQSGK